MRLNNLANLICRDVWLLDPRIAQGLMLPVAKYLNGEPVSFFDNDDEDEDPNMLCFSIDANFEKVAIQKGTTGNIFSGAPKGSIAVIPISGTIMKDDNCGAPGSDTMASWVKDAYAAENIAGILLHINSGGGSVAGTGEFGDVLTSANKPVIAYCDALMASAAYWLGSSAHEIIVSHKTVEIGSIGTAINFMDNSEALAQYGYKKHYINADSNPDKNKDYMDALKGDYKAIKTNILNPTNDIFMQHVKANRPGLKLTDVKIDGEDYQEPLTGKVYLAQAAIDNGLIDGIGSLEDAIARAQELAVSPTQMHTLKKSNDMFKPKFTKITALKDKKAAEITEGDLQAANDQIEAEGVTGVTLVADTELERLTNAQAAPDATALTAAQGQVTTLTADLATANSNVTKLTGELATANTAKTTAEASVVKLTADLAAANAKIKELGGEPAATHTSTVQTADDVVPGAKTITATYTEADASLAKLKAEQGTAKSIPVAKDAKGRVVANFYPAQAKKG
ncbi:S49 family peptidase [Mucilaginibacter sp.]